MMKRFISFAAMFFVVFMTCGCNKNAPMLFFNNQPINEVTVNNPVNIFELGETTHFVILCPKGFESPYLRIQVIKKEDKTQNWGYDVYYAKNLKVDTTKKFYIDSLKLHKKGGYIMTVYYLNNLDRAVVRSTFRVK